MVGGISGSSGVALAAARFDRAAAQVSASADISDVGDIPAAATGMSDAMASMATAQFAMLASMHAARTSNDMIMEAIKGL